jgi:hypothetical protein
VLVTPDNDGGSAIAVLQSEPLPEGVEWALDDFDRLDADFGRGRRRDLAIVLGSFGMLPFAAGFAKGTYLS